MFDYRLKVFNTVAKRLNFTKAAEELSITQPAVSKHIYAIETYYKCKLFERNGTKIKLTPSGELLLKQSEKLFEIYRETDYELANINENVQGIIRIGASTTVSQYVLPKYLAIFKKKFPEVKIIIKEANTEQIELLLIENTIDLGIVEGQSKRQHIKYEPFLRDEIVLCTSATNDIIKTSSIDLQELLKLPILIREQGSGSLEVIGNALKKHDIKFSQLSIEISLDSSESIKSYLYHSKTFAFLSIHSILNELKNNELKIIDINSLEISRYFYFITQQGNGSDLKDVFIKNMLSDKYKL